MVSGSNYSSKVNVIRKGISIRHHVTLDQLPPAKASGGIAGVGDRVILRFQGLDQPLLARIEVSRRDSLRGLKLAEV